MTIIHQPASDHPSPTSHTFSPRLGFGPVPPLAGPADPRVEDHRPVLSVTTLALFQLRQPPGEAAHTEAQGGPGHRPLHPRPV